MRPDNSARLAGAVVVAILLVGCGGRTDFAPLGDADVAAVRALSERYATAWLAGDTAGVLDIFADDAVLVPSSGAPQRKGLAAIRAFFWPPDSPPTSVVEFDRTSAEVAGSGTMGWEHGTYELALVFEDDTVRSAGNYLAVSARNPDGKWHWIAYSWSSRR